MKDHGKSDPTSTDAAFLETKAETAGRKTVELAAMNLIGVGTTSNRKKTRKYPRIRQFSVRRID